MSIFSFPEIQSTVVSNRILEDKNLSLAEKGFLSLLKSQAENDAIWELEDLEMFTSEHVEEMELLLFSLVEKNYIYIDRYENILAYDHVRNPGNEKQKD